jgi:hypothetical protein
MGRVGRKSHCQIIMNKAIHDKYVSVEEGSFENVYSLFQAILFNGSCLFSYLLNRATLKGNGLVYDERSFFKDFGYYLRVSEINEEEMDILYEFFGFRGGMDVSLLSYCFQPLLSYVHYYYERPSPVMANIHHKIKHAY